MKQLLLTTVFLSLVFVLKAQQTCTQRLNQAEDDYEAGRLLNIPQMIQGCLDNEGFSKEEEVRARKLLTLVYIFTDQQGKAEGALVNLLRADPEHRLNPRVDPAELFFLYEQFRVSPIFRIGFKAGVNISKINVVESYSTRNGLFLNTFYNGKEKGGIGEFQSSQGVGYNAELTIERHLKDGLEVVGGIQWRLSEYKVDMESILREDRTMTPLRSALTNEQMYIRTPVMLRYNFFYDNRDQKFLPYGFLGVSYDRLVKARYSNAERSPGTTFNLRDFDLRGPGVVNQNNLSIIGGIGTKVRIKTHFLTVEVRYDNSRFNYINSENRWTIQESVFDTAFVEDDLGIDVISFSVGWTHSIYNPKKLKEYR